MRDIDPNASEYITSGYLETSRPGGKFHDPGTAVMAGASVLGGVMGANASRDAANSQAAAADRATQAQRDGIAMQKQMFDKQMELQEPFRQNGITAQNQLMSLMQGKMGRGFTADDFQTDPGYQFRMGEGMNAIQNSAAARGGLLSGGTLKALQKYGQDFASNEYTNAYNRFNNDNNTVFNRYASIAGQGQAATNQMGNAAGNFGSNYASGMGQIGNNMMQAGNAQAAGMVGSANALSQGIGGAINGYQQNQLMQMLRKPTGGSSFGNMSNSDIAATWGG